MRVPIYERRAGIQPMSIPNTPPIPPVSDNGEAAGKAMQDMFARLQKIQDDTEDARTLDLITKFKQDSQAYHEDPTKGIYQTRLGFEAQGVYRDADEWLRKKGEDYVRQLPSERAKGAFRKLAKEYIIQRGQQNSRFEAAQVLKYRVETADAAYKNGLNDIGNNPYDDSIAERARQDMIQALELKLRYSSGETRQAALADLENDIAAARLTPMIAARLTPMIAARLTPMIKDDPIKAEKWFSEHKDSFSPQSRIKFADAIKNAAEIYKVQSTVDQLVKLFPQGQEQQALKYIRENFSGELEERIASAYKIRANELAVDLDREEKLRRKYQDTLEDRLLTEFYLNGNLPNDEQFRQLVADGQLRVEQAERLQSRAAVSVTRSRIEKQILASNPNLSQMELDEAVMRRLGVSQEEYRQTFSDAVQAVLYGQADSNALDFLYQRGRLTKHDVEAIKKQVKALDEAQKSYYRAEVKDLDTTIKALVQAGLPENLVQGIRDKFISSATTQLNPKSKTYREDLLKLKKHILVDAINGSGLSTTGFFGGLNDLGTLRAGIQDQTLQLRGIDPFPTLPELSPSPITLAPQAQTAQRTEAPASGSGSIVMSMVQGGSVPNGGGFTAPRGYRGGQHNGLDIKAPGGTDIIMRDFRTDMYVKKIHNDKKHGWLGIRRSYRRGVHGHV